MIYPSIEPNSNKSSNHTDELDYKKDIIYFDKTLNKIVIDYCKYEFQHKQIKALEQEVEDLKKELNHAQGLKQSQDFS